MNRKFLFVFTLLCLWAMAACSGPVAESPAGNGNALAGTGGELTLSLTTYATGLNEPVSLVNAGDDRLFVVEQDGLIKIIEEGGNVLPTPFLDIVDRVDSSSSEEGLLGLVFHPDYATNGYFYVNYTNTTSDIRRTRISRFSVTGDPNVADPNSENILLTVTQPFSNHNAGDIHFGPDGFLYVPLGDGGDGGDPQNNAQILTNLLGDLTRIDVDMGPGESPDCVGVGTGDYTIPSDNPFIDGPGNNCDEIWAYGLRNPWRSSFDRETGDFFMGDVGQGSWEEVDYQPAGSSGGENYGWSCYEGTHIYNQSRCDGGITYTFPIFEYTSVSNCSVIGGYVYRGSVYPAMVGRYFLSDYCTGNFWDLEPDGQGGWIDTQHTNLQQFGIAAFGEATDGELYVANTETGVISHLSGEGDATPTPPSTSTSIPPSPTATIPPSPSATADMTATATMPAASPTSTMEGTPTATATPFGTPVHLPVMLNGEEE